LEAVAMGAARVAGYPALELHLAQRYETIHA